MSQIEAPSREDPVNEFKQGLLRVASSDVTKEESFNRRKLVFDDSVATALVSTIHREDE
jgi:hypothetical protein